MQIYNKYIARSLFLPLLVITIILTGIIWLTQSLRFIDLIVNKGLGVSTFLYLSLLLIPSLLMLILPVAMFVATLMVYNKFISDSELIVFKAAGLSRTRLAVPAFIVAMSVTAFTYFISLYLLPVSYREFKETQSFIRNNYASVLLQEGVFSTPTKGLTVYIESRGDDGVLEGILVHDGRSEEKPVTYMAQQGRLVKTASGPRFEMVNGNRQEIDKEKGNLSVLYFDSYPFDLSVYAEDGGKEVKTSEERYINELFYPEESVGKDYGKFVAEGHYRITWPLFPLVFACIALAALFSGQFNRRGQWKRIVAATFFAVSVLIINLVIKGAAAQSEAVAILMYLNVLVCIAICLYILITNRVINNIPVLGRLLSPRKKSGRKHNKGRA